MHVVHLPSNADINAIFVEFVISQENLQEILWKQNFQQF